MTLWLSYISLVSQVAPALIAILPICPMSIAEKLCSGYKQLICERQRALYGIKCVLRIFWQTWQHIYWRIKIKLTLCKHDPCNILTHSTNEDLLNIKRKGDPEILYVRYHWNPGVIKVILLACFTYIDIFKLIKSLLTYWQEFLFLCGS